MVKSPLRSIVFAAVFAGLALSSPQAESRPNVVALAGASRAASPVIIASHERLQNLDTLKAALRRYHDCTAADCYAAELDHQADIAIRALDRRAAHHAPAEKLALVLDIDETTLSNYPEMLKEDFAYNSDRFDAWAQQAQAAAIPGTLRLCREAQRLGVAIFFITGRPEKERDATERNLTSQGFSGWQGLVLRAPDDKGKSAVVYKSAARKAIAAQGYRLVLNMGDQYSDLKGDPMAEVSVKLPNPFYLIP